MEIIYPSNFLNFIDEKNDEEIIDDNLSFNYRNLNDFTSEFETYSEYNEEDINRTPSSPSLMSPKPPRPPKPPTSWVPPRPPISIPLPMHNNWLYNYHIGPNIKAPVSPPPPYIPSRPIENIQSSNNSITKAYAEPIIKDINQKSLKFCLYKYTYIWQKDGRSYWAFIIKADETAISGYRWINYRWSYFGVDLRTIEAFECY